MASQASLTSAFNIIFILSLLLVAKFSPQVDSRPLEKPSKSTVQESKEIMGNNNKGNDHRSGGEVKANSLSVSKYNDNIDIAKMTQVVNEMKNLPPFPFAPLFPQPLLPPFPFPPPFDIPNVPPLPDFPLPPFPYSPVAIPDFPLPPFPFSPLPFLSPPPS